MKEARTQRTVEHRTARTPVEMVIEHVRFKLSQLPKLAAHYGPGPDAVAVLREYLLNEIKDLEALPPETPLGVVEPIDGSGMFIRQKEFSDLLEKAKKS